MRDAFLAAGALALLVGEPSGGDREREQDGEGGQQVLPQPGLSSELLAVAVLGDLARPQELLLARIQAAPSVRFVGPGAHDVEPGAAVQRGGVAALALPCGGGVGQLLVQQQSGAVGVDPVAQARPGVQQRFVRDLDGVAVEGDQPGSHERVERGGGPLRIRELPHQRDPVHTPSG